MGTLWVVAANKGFAKIYEVKGCGKEIKEIHHIDNPEGHIRGALNLSDRPGRAFDRQGVGRHALTDRDIHAREQEVFIDQISDFLKLGKENKEFDELALVAPPAFLGELKQQIPAQIKKCVVREVGKDLPEHLSEQTRIEHLCNYLDLWNHV